MIFKLESEVCVCETLQATNYKVRYVDQQYRGIVARVYEVMNPIVIISGPLTIWPSSRMQHHACLSVASCSVVYSRFHAPGVRTYEVRGLAQRLKCDQ